MPDVSDYYRVNAALLLVDSALATVLGERPDWKPVHQHHNAVLFMKTELRIKRSVESSPMGRASDIGLLRCKQTTLDVAASTAS